MTGSWRAVGSAVRYARGRLALREDTWRLPDGRERVYPVLAVGVTVGVLPFVAADRVLLVRQYRHLQRALSWELPGGGARPGETPEAAAHRELREEGGYRAGSLAPLTRFHPSNAYLDEIAYCFVARDLRHDPLPADDDEFLERAVLPLADAVRMALEGEITESVSKVAILQYALTAGRA
ncbi:MAG TPA: NUDIX hydrolase [Candidatus Tectomicrobia bacterium]|nr:NUDIX hydrolase [Candidatus Tectomicrobia bacterium]